MSIPRYFVEKVTTVFPNKDTGIVKITLAIVNQEKNEEVVQLLVSAGQLQEIFETVGETMQKTFGGNMGNRRGPGGKKPSFRGFKDLTK